MQNAVCWRWRFRGGGLVGLEQTRIYRSQELRTEMGSMLQVLFRFQLQPFLINWLLSSLANWGSAFDQWPHTQMGSDTQKPNHKQTLTLSVFCFDTYKQVHRYTRGQGCKTIQMSSINAHSAWEQDLHYFMLSSFNWLQDKMISEGIFHVVIFLFPHTEPPGINLQGEAFALGCVFLGSWFAIETHNGYMLKELADSCLVVIMLCELETLQCIVPEFLHSLKMTTMAEKKMFLSIYWYTQCILHVHINVIFHHAINLLKFNISHG